VPGTETQPECWPECRATTHRAVCMGESGVDRELEDKRGIAGFHNLGNVAINLGDYASARTLYEESLAIKR